MPSISDIAKTGYEDFVLKPIFNPLFNYDNQYRSLFEVLFLPYLNIRALFQPTLPNAYAIGAAALDTVVTKLYIKSISIPNFIEIVYEQLNDRMYATNSKFPEEVTFTFYENDLGYVRNYLMFLRQAIGKPHRDYGFIFNDNQDGAKKNCLISPFQCTGVPSPAVLKIEGMSLKSIGGIDFDQGASDPYEIAAVFAINSADWIVPANLL